MTRRTFFANLLGGIGAALWPWPAPKPIIVRAEPGISFVSLHEKAGWLLRSVKVKVARIEPATGRAEARFAIDYTTQGGRGTSSLPLSEVVGGTPLHLIPGLCDLAYRP